MAESSKDIESGCDGLKSPLRSEKEASIDKKLRNFGFKLALIEKGASTLGTMNFIWATVVLLGGFSQSLKSIDFWFVSVILVVEGLRILCRRGELATRRSSSPGFSVTTLIYLYSVLIQEYSAIACIVLSSLRILKQHYGSDGNLNRNRALNLFYWLSLVESSLTLSGFLVRGQLSGSGISPSDQEIPSFYRFFSDPGIPSFNRLISIVFDFYTELTFSVAVGQIWWLALEEDGFDDSQFNVFRLFFFETYSRCINGSVFDGLKMDFVSYSLELLQSTDDNEQLITGAQLLSALVKSDRLPSEKLRAIGATPGVLGRLIELLNWEKPHQQKIRTVAAQIISKLVEIPRNRIPVIAFPESMESIQSLLYDRNQIRVHSSKYQGQSSDEYNYSYLSELGLWILEILANDPDNCAKLETNKVLLRKITELAKLNPGLSESAIVMHLKSLPRPASLGRQQDDRENINATSG